MPNRNKPFVVYKRASGWFTIVPRGVKGWLQMIFWLALLAGLCAWFVDHYVEYRMRPELGTGVLLFVSGLIAWSLCFIWFVFARAEVLDRDVWLRDQARKNRHRQ